MTIHLTPDPVLAIVAGVGILAFPKFFRFIVAAYLILFGLTRIIA